MDKRASQQRRQRSSGPTDARHAEGKRLGVEEALQHLGRFLERPSGGRAVPDAIRSHVGGLTGQHVGRAELHSDAEVGHIAKALGARALAVGQHVLIDPSYFAPGTARGDALIAHELTHVAQASGQMPALDTLRLEPEGSPAERQAEHVAAAVGGLRSSNRAPTQEALVGPLVRPSVGVLRDNGKDGGFAAQAFRAWALSEARTGSWLMHAHAAVTDNSSLGGSFLRMYLDHQVDPAIVSEAGQEIQASSQWAEYEHDLVRGLHTRLASEQPGQPPTVEDLKAWSEGVLHQAPIAPMEFRGALNAIMGGVSRWTAESARIVSNDGQRLNYEIEVELFDTYDFENERTGAYDAFRKELSGYIAAGEYATYMARYHQELYLLQELQGRSFVFAAHMYAIEKNGLTPGPLAWSVTLPMRGVLQLDGQLPVRPPASAPPSVSLESRGGATRKPASEVARLAGVGISRGAQPLPFRDRIESAFGGYDLSGLAAHIGPEATAASREIGAAGYIIGGHVAFDGYPDLETAAHEAVHYVQERSGRLPSAGVSRPDHAHEREAARVAGAVAAGRSAEGLLQGIGSPLANRALRREGRQGALWPSPIGPEAGSDAVSSEHGVSQQLENNRTDLPFRSAMESAFGQDFSAVVPRFGATAMLDAHEARGAAIGNEVFFRTSSPDPRLVAHELAHIAQLRKFGPAAAVAPVSHRTDRAEAEARDVADRVVAGHTVEVHEAPSAEVSLSDGALTGTSGWVMQQVIDALDAAGTRLLAANRALVEACPDHLKPVAQAVVEAAEAVGAIGKGLIEAVCAVGVGFVSGAIGMIWGLIRVLIKVLELLWDILQATVDGGEALNEDVTAIVEGVKRLPSALRTLVNNWLERFNRASSDQQTVMIGLLTGEILALIASFGVGSAAAGGRAGTAGRAGAAGEVAELGRGVAGAEEIATTARTSSEAADVASVGGRGGEVAELGRGAAGAEEIATTARTSSEAADVASVGGRGTRVPSTAPRRPPRPKVPKDRPPPRPRVTRPPRSRGRRSGLQVPGKGISRSWVDRVLRQSTQEGGILHPHEHIPAADGLAAEQLQALARARPHKTSTTIWTSRSDAIADITNVLRKNEAKLERLQPGEFLDLHGAVSRRACLTSARGAEATFGRANEVLVVVTKNAAGEIRVLTSYLVVP